MPRTTTTTTTVRTVKVVSTTKTTKPFAAVTFKVGKNGKISVKR